MELQITFAGMQAVGHSLYLDEIVGGKKERNTHNNWHSAHSSRAHLYLHYLRIIEISFHVHHFRLEMERKNGSKLTENTKNLHMESAQMHVIYIMYSAHLCMHE